MKNELNLNGANTPKQSVAMLTLCPCALDALLVFPFLYFAYFSIDSTHFPFIESDCVPLV